MSLSIVPLDLNKISLSEREVYRQFLDKSFWMCLKGHDPWAISTAKIIAVAAFDANSTAVGLAISTYYPHNAFAQLLSLRTAQEYCTDEIYSQLFAKMSELLISEKCSFVMHSYSSMDPAFEKIENLFRQLHAPNPQLIMVRCHFDLQGFAPAWFTLYRSQPLPANLDIIPWKKLSQPEIEKLRELQEQGSFSASISPFYEESMRDANLSLVVRDQGEIIGWIILHRIESDTIRFSTFYVERDFRGSNVSAWLLVRAIQLAQQTKYLNAIFEFNLEQVDRAWIAFVKKRLAPFAAQTERVFQVALNLN